MWHRAQEATCVMWAQEAQRAEEEETLMGHTFQSDLNVCLSMYTYTLHS